MKAIHKSMVMFVLLFTAMLSAQQQQQKTTVKGKVTDEQARPLSFVNVFIPNSPDGVMSEGDGSFSFTTKLKGRVTLTASMVGYKTWKKELTLINEKEINVEIKLEEKAVSLKEAVVTASSYGTEKEKGLVLSRIDVLTTPGGAADIFQSLKTMPGLTQVSESAELYVRGGDPLETTAIIDQAPVYHTFTFESGYGGLFSNINQSVVKSLYFTSGGFSAKYGNSLSGILDIETAGIPSKKNLSLGLSMANASVTAEAPFSENLGAYFDYRQSFTRPIFWLNGGLDRFTSAPASKNATGSVIYSYSKTGRIKLFGVFAEDKEGVNVENAEYNGEFQGDSKNSFFNLQNSGLIADNILMKNSISYNKYSNQWMLGVLDISKTDKVYSLRNDFEYVLSSRSKLLAGFELENRSILYEGIIPSHDYNIRPDAPGDIINSQINGMRWAIYSEYQWLEPLRIKKLSLSAGVRFDRLTKLKQGWVDPRLNLGYKLNDKSGIRLSLGIFHQSPDPRLFSETDGNPDLKAMRAIHYIASYDYIIDEQNSFRIELYHKDYSSLPLENPLINYDNSGYGFSEGADIIFKGTLPFDITGWISYGFINTKRLWMDFTQYTSSSYDITHNLAVVTKYNISQKLQIGISAKYATGKPFTDVISAEYNPEQNIYEPKHEPTNSSRFPDYKRVDLRINYFDQLFGLYPVVAYMEALNILNFKNIFGYSYSEDYKEKRTIQSYFGQRMIVLGFTVNIN